MASSSACSFRGVATTNAEAAPGSPRISAAEASATMREPAADDSSRPAASAGTTSWPRPSRRAHGHGEGSAREREEDEEVLAAAARARCLRKWRGRRGGGHGERKQAAAEEEAAAIWRCSLLVRGWESGGSEASAAAGGDFTVNSLSSVSLLCLGLQ